MPIQYSIESAKEEKNYKELWEATSMQEHTLGWVLQAPQCWEVRQLPWPSNENCKDSSLLRQIGNVQLQTWPLNWQGPHLNVWFCTELLRSIFVRKGSHVPRRQRATCLRKCQVNFTKRTSSVILHPMERGHEAPKLLSIVNVHSAQH